MKLAGKVAIVTGAAQGIGRAIALKLAGEGAAAVVNDINIEKANHVVQEIKNAGGTAAACKADVTRRTEVQDMMKYVKEKFGAIHILVNNAGIVRLAPLLKMTDEDWDAVQNVDLKAVFICSQTAAQYMIEQRYGKIINISSNIGMGHVGVNRANYAAAKGGVIQLTMVAARELGPYGINVNSIAPGVIVTDLTFSQRTKAEAEKFIAERKSTSVLGRVGKPDDIANLALFLASDDADFITGQVIRVDGGRTDRM